MAMKNYQALDFIFHLISLSGGLFEHYISQQEYEPKWIPIVPLNEGNSFFTSVLQSWSKLAGTQANFRVS